MAIKWWYPSNWFKRSVGEQLELKRKSDEQRMIFDKNVQSGLDELNRYKYVGNKYDYGESNNWSGIDKKSIKKIDTDSKSYVDVWNDAIEAAELELHKKLPYPTQACAIVRGLKK